MCSKEILQHCPDCLDHKDSRSLTGHSRFLGPYHLLSLSLVSFSQVEGNQHCEQYSTCKCIRDSYSEKKYILCYFSNNPSYFICLFFCLKALSKCFHRNIHLSPGVFFLRAQDQLWAVSLHTHGFIHTEFQFPSLHIHFYKVSACTWNLEEHLLFLSTSCRSRQV